MVGLSFHPEWAERNIQGFGEDDVGSDGIGWKLFEDFEKMNMPSTPYVAHLE